MTPGVSVVMLLMGTGEDDDGTVYINMHEQVECQHFYFRPLPLQGSKLACVCKDVLQCALPGPSLLLPL